jgi:hypothetical protein
VMGLHPLPHSGASTALNLAVHTLAIVVSPIAFFGGVELSKKLGTKMATYYQLFGLVVGTIAPIMSGFVAPTHPSQEVASFAWVLNQTCTRIWVGGVAIAFVLWSFASWREKLLPRPLAIYGFVCGAAVLAFVFSGLPFDVHHTGAVALLEAIFSIGAGVVMIRSSSARSQPAPFPA